MTGQSWRIGMTFISVAGIIGFFVIAALGLLIKVLTHKKVEELDGFNGIIDLEKAERDAVEEKTADGAGVQNHDIEIDH